MPFTILATTAYTSAAGDVTGGYGGAIFTGDSGVTSISGLESAYHNSAFSGGALYNEGTTLLTETTNEFTTRFADNEATVRDISTNRDALIVSQVGKYIIFIGTVSGLATLTM